MAELKEFGPAQFKTEAEWLALAKDPDVGKGVVGETLRAIGIPVQTYLGKKWTAEQRVAAIIEHQTKNGWKPGAAAKAPATGQKKADTAASTAKAPAASKASTADASAPAAPTKSDIIIEKLEALTEKFEALSARIEKIDALLSDTHFGVRTLVVMQDYLELAGSEEFHADNFEVLIAAGAAAEPEPEPKKGRKKGKPAPEDEAGEEGGEDAGEE